MQMIPLLTGGIFNYTLDVIINEYYYLVNNSTHFSLLKGGLVVDSSSLTKKFQKEMNAGIASLVLLSVLDKSTEPMYGYQIAKLLEEYSGDASFMKQGALYPVLHSLENSGLLKSMVEPSVSGPPRRYYTITSEGRETLATWQGVWKQMKSFVDRAIKGG
jgi:PadR family transcriptional regulator PadR